jgi:hypothetical protein
LKANQFAESVVKFTNVTVDNFQVAAARRVMQRRLLRAVALVNRAAG